MNKLYDEYKVSNIKVINERVFLKNNKNIIELLYNLFLLTKDSNNYDYDKDK